MREAEVTHKTFSATNCLTPSARGQTGPKRRSPKDIIPYECNDLPNCDWHDPCTVVGGSEHDFPTKREPYATDKTDTKITKANGSLGASQRCVGKAFRRPGSSAARGVMERGSADRGFGSDRFSGGRYGA